MAAGNLIGLPLLEHVGSVLRDLFGCCMSSVQGLANLALETAGRLRPLQACKVAGKKSKRRRMML